jgi:hypoxanthine phosphoribosyltransferase
MRTLFDQNAIAQRLQVIGAEIVADLGPDFVLAPVLTGGYIFGADLARAIQGAGGDPETDFVQLASYGAERQSSGLVRVVRDFTLDLQGRTVLLVDDVLDSGRSLAHACAMLEERRAARVAVAVAVTKDKPRAADITADYALFEAPGDAFLVGYGMDDQGRKRGVPVIGAL